MVLGKIFLYSALPLTMALSAPFAKADTLSDLNQNLTRCNVDPNVSYISNWQDCYNVIRGGIWLNAVALSQTIQALKDQCNQTTTPPNLTPSLADFFEDFARCNVEPTQVSSTQWKECYNVLRGGLWLYAASLNQAKTSLNECTEAQSQTQTSATAINSVISNSLGSGYEAEPVRIIDGDGTIRDSGGLIETNPFPTIDSDSPIETNPFPTINY